MKTMEERQNEAVQAVAEILYEEMRTARRDLEANGLPHDEVALVAFGACFMPLVMDSITRALSKLVLKEKR